MKEMNNKKQLVLIPSAYNHKVMGDIENFIDYYMDKFEIYIICDKYKDNLKEENKVTYVNNKCSYAQYLKITADYIIDAGSINGFTKFSNSQKRISVWHGIPYKNMFVKLDSKYYKQALEYDYGIDLMISPSKFYTKKFLRESMLYEGNVLETAVSRTDSLFLSKEKKNKIKEEIGVPKDKKILLYAPTFREEGTFKLPFNPSELIKKLPSDDWIIVTKLHYLNTLENSNNVIDATNYPIVNNLLAISDALITDYSSLFFDYSILQKPTIFYQYDKEQYEENRGFMFELTDYVDEKYIVQNEDELYNLVEKIDKIKSNLEKIRKEFYPHQKKDSTKQLVEKLNLDATPRKTKEIIFLVNELNQIGGIHNFVLNLAKEFKYKYNSKIIVIGKKEFIKKNDKVHFFDSDNIVDIKLSKELNPKQTKQILENTDGYIIGCQFGAFMSMQQYVKNKKTLLMFHGDTKDIVQRTYYKTHLDYLNNYSLTNYMKLALLTKSNKDILYDYVNPDIKEKLTYIEDALDFTGRKNLYKKNGEFVAVTRLDNDKNPEDLIKIFSNKNLNKDYKIHVYGDGGLKKDFENKIKELKVEDKVILHGYCDNKEEMYKDKQGLVMTSLTEGFSYIILEAYKYGIPVYSYDSFTAISDVLNDKTGRKIKTGDIDEYVKVLNENFDIKNSDFDEFIEKFSNDNILKKWINLFSELDEEEHKLLELQKKTQPEKSLTLVTPKKVHKKLKKKKVKFKRRLLNSHSLKASNLYIEISTLKFRIKKLFSRKKEPLVSIIMPFYNNNATIDKALKSIKKCGYKNYEVLVINDGSEENPQEICNKYKKVKYFYKKNEGPGLTRNFGIDHAKGEYVFFLDSDDEICKSSLNIMVDFALKEKLDVVCGLCRRVYVESKHTSYWYPLLYRKRKINEFPNREKVLDDSISTSKLYNLRELKKSNIRFAPGFYEDVLFMAEIYKYFPNIGYIPNVTYTWNIYGKDTSITTTITMENIYERIDKVNKIINISNENMKIQYMKIFINHHMYVLINNFNRYSEDKKKEIYNLIRKQLIDNKQYIYERIIYQPAKKSLIRIILDDNYNEFYKIATLISEEFFKVIKDLSSTIE